MSGITILSIAGILLAVLSADHQREITKLKERIDAQQKLITAWQERNEILSDIVMMIEDELKNLKKK